MDDRVEFVRHPEFVREWFGKGMHKKVAYFQNNMTQQIMSIITDHNLKNNLLNG